MAPLHKRLNWKVAAAGGAVAGLAMSGAAFADSGGPELPAVDDLRLVPVDSLASPGSEIVTTTRAPAPSVLDSNSVSVTTPSTTVAPTTFGPAPTACRSAGPVSRGAPPRRPCATSGIVWRI